MADDKKNIPDVSPPTEASAPTAEVAAVPEPLAPDPVLTDAEAVMLEHEGQAALFEMGETVPDPADAVTRAEVEESAAPEVPKAEKEQVQSPTPGKDDPTPAHSGKVVDFAAARNEAVKDEKKRSSRSRPRKRASPPSPAKAVRPRRKKRPRSRVSRPRLARPMRHPRKRQRPRPRKCRLRPVTPPAPRKRKSSILTFPTCTRSRIILSVSVTMRK